MLPHYGVTLLAFVLQRVVYKLATVIYKSLHGQAPSYLVDDCLVRMLPALLCTHYALAVS